MLVESPSLRILLIDRKPVDRILIDALLQKPSAKAFASGIRFDEQHLKRAILHSHEGYGLAFIIHGHQEVLDSIQSLRNIPLDAMDLGFLQEEMGSPYRRFPYCKECIHQFR